MQTVAIAVIVSIVVALSGFFIYYQTGQTTNVVGGVVTSACEELTQEELDSVVGAFLKKKGYDNHDIVTVSPIFCENNKIGVRNMVVSTTIDEGLPTQHNKTLRLQMRSDATELKIYEVVLTNPT